MLSHSAVVAAVLVEERGEGGTHQLVLIPGGVLADEASHAHEQRFGDFSLQAHDLLLYGTEPVRGYLGCRLDGGKDHTLQSFEEIDSYILFL